jgi:late competence protein required for DNA uptake (superfamily II DNA/RNA helicase)
MASGPVAPPGMYLPANSLPPMQQTQQPLLMQTALNSTIQTCSRCNQQKMLPFLRFSNNSAYCQSCVLQIMNPLNEPVELLKEAFFITKDGKTDLENIMIDFRATSASI